MTPLPELVEVIVTAVLAVALATYVIQAGRSLGIIPGRRDEEPCPDELEGDVDQELEP